MVEETVDSLDVRTPLAVGEEGKEVDESFDLEGRSPSRMNEREKAYL